jgi:hypothetical protein
MKEQRVYPTYVQFAIPYIAIVATVILTIVSVNTYKTDVERVIGQQEVVDSALDKQKICGDETPQFCRDLFERLSDNISDAQRERLACTVAEYLVVQLKPGTNCPKE